MQVDDIEDELRQSIAAFAIPSVYCLIRIICTRISSPVLHPRPDWYILFTSWFASGVAGSTLAVLTARTGDVRFRLGLKGVGLLSVELLLVIVFSWVFQIYRDVPKPLWLPFLAAFGAASHSFLLVFGLWQVIVGGVEFIWLAPSTHHFVLFLFFVSLCIDRGYYWGWTWGWQKFGWWGVGFLIANLVAFVLPVVSVALRTTWAHLSQCLSCFVVVLFYDVRICWKWWDSLDDKSSGMDLKMLCRGTVGAKTREDGSEAEGSTGSGSWDGQAGVRPPPHVHIRAQGVGAASLV